MSAVDHERFEDDLGAYLLGALPELEAERFQRHLRGCQACQQEAMRLRVAVDALPRAVPALEPPPSLKRAVMKEVRADQRRAARAETPPRERTAWLWPRLRIPQIATVTALVIGLVVGLGVATLGGDSRDPRTIAAEVDSNRLAGARGALVVSEDDSGRAILRMSDLPPAGRNRVYEVWVSHDGRVRPASLFEPQRDGSAVAGIEGDVADADAVLVTRERRGGVATPTEDPVISVSL